MAAQSTVRPNPSPTLAPTTTPNPNPNPNPNPKQVALLRSVPPSATRVYHQRDFSQLLAAEDPAFAERLDDLLDEQVPSLVITPPP